MYLLLEWYYDNFVDNIAITDDFVDNIAFCEKLSLVMILSATRYWS